MTNQLAIKCDWAERCTRPASYVWIPAFTGILEGICEVHSGPLNSPTLRDIASWFYERETFEQVAS